MRRNRFDARHRGSADIIDSKYRFVEAFLCVMKRIPNDNKFEYIAAWNAYSPSPKDIYIGLISSF